METFTGGNPLGLRHTTSRISIGFKQFKVKEMGIHIGTINFQLTKILFQSAASAWIKILICLQKTSSYGPKNYLRLKPCNYLSFCGTTSTKRIVKMTFFHLISLQSQVSIVYEVYHYDMGNRISNLLSHFCYNSQMTTSLQTGQFLFSKDGVALISNSMKEFITKALSDFVTLQ